MFNKISKNQKDLALELRHQGYSLSEIVKRTGISKTTLSIMMSRLVLSNEAKEILYNKNFKSKNDSKREWEEAGIWSEKIIGELNVRDKLLILAMIYWGEGTKKELNIINSDPMMLKVFLFCLRSMGINSDDIRVSLRLFPNCNMEKSKEFWSKNLDIDKKQITNFELVTGSKKHKHAYGMCRIRLKRGGLYFKKIMSIINTVKNKLP